MDYKDFKDGLTSLSLVLFIFSFTFLIGSVALKPFISLKTEDMWFIILLCSINILFSFYFLWEALRLDKVFKLEDKHIIKFGKRIAIFTCFYLPHYFLFITLFLRELNNLEVMMAGLIFFIESLLIGVLFKEVHDLLFIEESERKFELDKNRKLYIEKEKKSIPGE